MKENTYNPIILLKKTKHLIFVIKRVLLRKTSKIMGLYNVKRIIRNVYGLNIVSLKKNPYLVIVAHNAYHPTSSMFIRLISPISIIAKKNNFSVALVDGSNPRVSEKTKVVIIQRTAIKNINLAKEFINDIKQNNIKLIVDTDDSFSDIDKSHPQYQLQSERIKSLNYILKYADMVWFSTDMLAAKYQVDNYKIIKNTLDKRVWSCLGDIRRDSKEKILNILYMGTRTHDNDFKIIKPVFENLNMKYSGMFKVSVIGVTENEEKKPWLIYKNPENGLYPLFVGWFQRHIEFHIGVAPLEDSEFNECKSDIKCLDYMAIGAKPIVSNVSAYKNTELNLYIERVNNNQDEWYNAIEKEIISFNKNKSYNEQCEFILKNREVNSILKLIEEDVI